MKTLNIFTIAIIALSMLGHQPGAYSQDEENQSALRIYSADINIGYYNPLLDYWNDTYFKDNGWENKFKGNITLGADIKFSFIPHTSVKIGYNYWNEGVKSGDLIIDNELVNEEIQLTFSNICIGFQYYPEFARFEEFKPFIGIEGAIVFIRNKFTLQTLNKKEVNTEYGQDITGKILLGIERPVFKNLGIGINCGYVFGRYVQKVIINQQETEHNVSLNGISAELSISYFF